MFPVDLLQSDPGPFCRIANAPRRAHTAVAPRYDKLARIGLDAETTGSVPPGVRVGNPAEAHRSDVEASLRRRVEADRTSDLRAPRY